MAKHLPVHGRGASHHPPNRFDALHVEREAWVEAEDPAPRTRFYGDATRDPISTNDSPDVPMDLGINPYRGCEHGCVYCLHPDTPVLHSDLIWRPIGEVRPGDELVGFDEHPEPGRRRKLRRAVVGAVWWSRRPTFRLITERANVVATAEHRWLQARDFRWSRTEALRPGQLLRHLAVDGPCDDESIFGRTPATDPDRVVAVETGPVCDVVDIQTSTGTFYAGGLATHNCFARPFHEYLGFDAGLDFETKIVVKHDAPRLLRERLASPRWEPKPLMMSGATDPYQPAERRLRVTRGVLEVLAEFRQPVAVITKNHLVTRDVDLLADMAADGAAAVALSVTTLRNELQRVMEPRTSVPARRLAAIETLAKAGVPVSVNVAPVIPGLTDHELPAILQAAADAGASGAGFILLRLPHGVEDLFVEWLGQHFPDRRDKVLNRLRDLRGGAALYDSRWGMRKRGEGAFAEQIRDMFHVAARRAGLDGEGRELSSAAFRRPHGPGGQTDLFG